MKKKEIKEKFEKLDKQIKNLEKGHEDLYEVTQFILEAIRKYTDEPIYRIKLSDDWSRHIISKEYLLQYAYKNKIKEITTFEDIQSVELFAYCDTHFILKNHNNKYFLVDMANKTMTNIPAQLLFSKSTDLMIAGSKLKIYCDEFGTMGLKND